MTLHWFDTLAGAILIFFAAMGAWRGFVREIFPALSLLGGGAAAAAFQAKVSQLLSSVVKEGLGRDIAAYVIIFLAVWGAVALIGVGARKLSGGYQSVTTANHVAGFILGSAKGAIALAIVVVTLSLAPSMKKDVVKNSYSGPPFASFTNFALETLSPGLGKKLDDPANQGVIERAGAVKKAVETLELKGVGAQPPAPPPAKKNAQAGR